MCCATLTLTQHAVTAACIVASNTIIDALQLARICDTNSHAIHANQTSRKVSGPLCSQSIGYGLSYVDDGVLFLFDAYRLGVLCFSAVQQLGHPASHCCDHICMANMSYELESAKLSLSSLSSSILTSLLTP